jgi:uncharacterized protein YndB with AHSA1/START domain
MLVRALAAATLTLAVAGPAAAEVKSVTPNGFEVATAAEIAAPPDRVYAALGEVGRWWSPSHTFSRDAGNLSMELRAGGCFCEQLKDGGSVQHLQVVYAAPGQGLRLRGALGPLQTEGVDGTLSWTLKPGEGGTTVTSSYVLGGYIRSGMEMGAPGRPGARRAAAAPQKLHRRQIPAAIAPLDPPYRVRTLCDSLGHRGIRP